MTTELRTWYARICCPVCYGPVRAPLHAKEGRCRGCRPKRQHSQPRPTHPRTSFARFVATHRASQ
ncbi:hypothetical protein ACI798_01395 [Geodermatophilus sp. SYSU D01045]